MLTNNKLSSYNPLQQQKRNIFAALSKYLIKKIIKFLADSHLLVFFLFICNYIKLVV